MSVGLIALLDDVAALAKAAAASLDDVASQAARAGVKAAGVVIDDTAVTPRYVVGFSAHRELPIVRKIAVGSLRNKLVFLLPAALLLSYALPEAITPLLMLGGAYLCYEGAEKVYELILPHEAHLHEAALPPMAFDPQSFEDEMVAGAIRTDFILSAEIMAITLASVSDADRLTQAVVLALVGVGITFAVYGAVALIVKADDVGVALAQNPRRSTLGALSRALGRALALGMPAFLTALSALGTAAMIWVGGSIVVHGLEESGWSAIAHAIEVAGAAAADALPSVASAAEWFVATAGFGLAGLVIGAMLIPLVSFVFSPAWRLLSRVLRRGTRK
jgi:predicted DNA repair protein MutK